MFPCLLGELMETLCGKASVHGTYMSDNLKSGFEAIGICPFNPDRVLKKLPQEPANADNDPASLVSETVVELLKNMRYGSDEPTRHKKSKLNVAPGKSISLEDLHLSTSSDAGPSTSSNCTRKRKAEKAKKKLSVRVPVPVKHSRKTAERSSDIEPDSDEQVHNSSDSDASSDHEVDSSNNTSTMQAANEEKLTTASGAGTGVGSLSGGNYFIVRFAKKKDRFKYYIAQVCSLPADQKSEVEVSCLRKTSGGSSTADLRFVWPDNPDTAFVHHTDVLHLLPKPISERRGVVVLVEFSQLLVLLLNRDSQRTVN